jgi:multiple sugar transport system permease protein
VFFAIFNFYPMGYAFYLSFMRWDMLSAPHPVGFANYTAIFNSQDFRSSLLITMEYTVESTVPLIVLSLGLALLLNQRLRFHDIFRVIYFIPCIMPAVVVAVVWGLLYQPTGAVNNIIGLAGINPVPWISSERYAVPALDIVTIWSTFGYDTLILLAGLQSISPDYHEAAAIDGASGGAILRHITLPLLAPRFLFVTSTTVAGVMTAFVLPYVMTNGGPGAATRTLPLLIYQSAFQFLNAGQASAMAFVLLVITLIFTFVQFRVFGSEVA